MDGGNGKHFFSFPPFPRKRISRNTQSSRCWLRSAVAAVGSKSDRSLDGICSQSTSFPLTTTVLIIFFSFSLPPFSLFVREQLAVDGDDVRASDTVVAVHHARTGCLGRPSLALLRFLAPRRALTMCHLVTPIG